MSYTRIGMTYITASWHSGANWWVTWSDGRIEQGGRANSNVITFHKAFKSQICTINANTVGSVFFACNISWYNLTQFEKYQWQSAAGLRGTYDCLWYACGY